MVSRSTNREFKSQESQEERLDVEKKEVCRQKLRSKLYPRGSVDSSRFICNGSQGTLFLLLFVDDIILTGCTTPFFLGFCHGPGPGPSQPRP